MDKTNSRPWHFDARVYEQAEKAEQSEDQSPDKKLPYQLIEAGPEDYKRIIALYLKSPLPGYQITRLEAVYNQAMEEGFASRVQLLKEREGNPAFEPT